ncbi:hypothetical protein GOP47_0019165 [Adiantum capillus-veneris]|uniref:Uncharacterized protein n=1 Tax=Adiantum capillus-veneris TaxID=13818 RepID=A0A9D4UFX5_ADICA|nr:hypothetical protein GOP47_0019165 [Adiantum capillus-veneris]
MEVFDSKSGVWKDASFPLFQKWQGNVWDGNFFILARDDVRCLPTNLVAYHVASGVWSMQPVQMFRDVTDEDECYQVHKYRGRLYFALEMWPERYGYRIWEVVKAGLEASEWVEAACTP